MARREDGEQIDRRLEKMLGELEGDQTQSSFTASTDFSSQGERSKAFFNREADVLERDLYDRDIVEHGTTNRLRIRKAQAFSRVGDRYAAAMEQMEPGDLWSPPQRTIRQSLVIARALEGGACIRLLQGAYYDPEAESFTVRGTEGTIADFLSLEKNERAQLRFLDESDTLYLIHGMPFTVSRSGQ